MKRLLGKFCKFADTTIELGKASFSGNFVLSMTKAAVARAERQQLIQPGTRFAVERPLNKIIVTFPNCHVVAVDEGSDYRLLCQSRSNVLRMTSARPFDLGGLILLLAQRAAIAPDPGIKWPDSFES